MLQLALLFLLSGSVALKVRENQTTETLADWLNEGRCFNIALTPQYNNQHSMFGITEYLRKNNLLQNLAGISACSGGSLPGVYMAANKSFEAFNKSFPHQGWGGFGPSEPKISDDYVNFLSTDLPKTFEELKHPFALSLTHWADLKGLKSFDPNSAKSFSASSGDLHQALMAAVTTSSAMSSSCPYCSVGFWPKKVDGKFPVTDGAFGDLWGTAGMDKLPKCPKLLLLLPLDYPDQVEPPKIKQIPGSQGLTEMVSLVIVQPPSGSHSYIAEKSRAGAFVTKKTSAEWNNAMYQGVNRAMVGAIESRLPWKKGEVGKSAVLTLDGKLPETASEKLYDRAMSEQRDVFWAFWKDGAESKELSRDWNQTVELRKRVDKKHVQRLLADAMSGKL